MNNTTDEISTPLREVSVTWDKVLVGIVLYGITLITIFGNLMVLAAVAVEKKLRTTFNYYIVNLAVTDVAVAVTAMSFMATYTVLGYWPFGELLCAVWIFFDYGMTFVSVFTLILISVDRLWSVTWCLHYRTHHTKKTCFIFISIVWLFMLFLWVPPWLVDRLRHSEPDVCFWDPSENMELVFIVAVLGHHGPYIIMLYCYMHVFIVMRKRTKSVVPQRSVRGAPSENSISMIRREKNLGKNLDKANDNKPQQTQLQNVSPSSVEADKVTSYTDNIDNSSRFARERRIFVTLTYVIFGYAILWLPFHIVFDITIAKPNYVPNGVWHVAFWMTYLNSTVNPFLYCFSSLEFRRTFKRLWCR